MVSSAVSSPTPNPLLRLSWSLALLLRTVVLTYNHMVVSAGAGEDHADRIFRALADRTRRDIVRRAMGGTLSVSGLARLYPMSTTAVQKHVAVLEEAGLVQRTRRGREQLVQTNINTVAQAGQLLAQIEQLWRDRLERVGDVLAEPERGEGR
jgi:DNA-binding transcriptional ArsR family regulator